MKKVGFPHTPFAIATSIEEQVKAEMFGKFIVEPLLFCPSTKTGSYLCYTMTPNHAFMSNSRSLKTSR